MERVVIFLCIRKELQRASGYSFTERQDFYNVVFKMRHTYIQGVRGGMCQTSGECSLS